MRIGAVQKLVAMFKSQGLVLELKDKDQTKVGPKHFQV